MSNDKGMPLALDYGKRNRTTAGGKAGLIILILSGLFILAGVPVLYGAGAVNITLVNQLGRFLCIAIVALGIDLVWGYAGILTLCQAMFFCIGGYAIGMHMALHGPLDGDAHDIPRCLFVVSSEVSGTTLPWFWRLFQTLPAALCLGLILPGLFAFIFGYFSFRSRVRGVYFSIITQATTVAVMYVLRNNEMKLCGTNGLTNFVTLAGFDLQEPRVKLGLYMLSAVLLVLVFLMCWFIVNSRAGRLLKAVRDNESRLRFAGYQPVTFKVFAFALAAVIAGLGGMLYTPQNGIITPYKMEAVESITLVVCVAVGGRSSLTGAIIGAIGVNFLNSLLTSGVFYSMLPKLLQVQSDLVGENYLMGRLRAGLKIVLGAEGWPLFLGGLFIAVTLFFPDGIVGLWRKLVGVEEGSLSEGIAADEASSDAEVTGSKTQVEANV